MFFQNLPDHIKEAIKKLPKDELFQERFSKDEKLDELDELKINKAEEYQILQLILHNNLEDTFFRKITPAVWCFLWIVDCPLVTKSGEISQLDVDLMLYVMKNRC